MTSLRDNIGIDKEIIAFKEAFAITLITHDRACPITSTLIERSAARAVWPGKGKRISIRSCNREIGRAFPRLNIQRFQRIELVKGRHSPPAPGIGQLHDVIDRVENSLAVSRVVLGVGRAVIIVLSGHGCETFGILRLQCYSL